MTPTPLNRLLGTLIVLLLSACALSTQAQTPTPEPQPNLELLTNGEVYTVARQSNGSLVIGGRFSEVGGTPRANIARITATGELDASFNPGTDDAVRAIVIDASGNLYVGGAFFNIGGQARNRLARLSSTGAVDAVWNPNANDTVHALALSAQGLYVGGAFSGVGGGALQRRIARVALTGSGARDTSFSPVLNSGEVLAITVDASGNVYIGGSFGDVAAVTTRARLARFSSAGVVDASWLPQPNEVVRALLLQGSQLYVGGDFTQISGQTIWRLARIASSGSAAADTGWIPNSVGSVRALGADSAGAIYAAGSFTQIGGQTRARLAKLNPVGVGVAFADWNPGADGDVHALAVDFDGSVAAGGNFATAGAQTRWGLLRLNPTATVLASPEFQLPGTVHDIGVQSTGGLIIGGNFRRANGVPRRHLLRLDANNVLDPNWLPEPNAPVRVTTMSSAAVVYVGGEFTQIGGQTRNRLARLSTSGTGTPDTWNPSANGIVHTILINSSDNAIMVGGEFSQVGGQSRANIAKLSNAGTGLANTVWNPGSNGVVYTLAQRSNDLFVGGAFTTLGGQTRNNIGRVSAIDAGAVNATWNPSADGPVFALLSSGEFIYVGGGFGQIGGQSRASLARLNPAAAGLADASWGPFTLSGRVRSLVVAGGLLYVGGDFGTQAASAPPPGPRGLTRLMVASGSPPPTWTPTTNAPVHQLRSTSDGLLLVGGSFGSVSGQTRKGLAALARLQQQAPLSISANTNPIAVGATTGFTVTGGSGTGAGSIAVTAGASFCTITSGVLTGIAAGSCTVTATKAGDANFAPTSASTTVTVARAEQVTLTLNASPASIPVGATSTLSTSGGSGTGAVSYAITAGAGSCSLAGSIVTGSAVGSCTVTATKAGDANFNPATATRVITVTQASQATLTVTATPSSIVFGGSSTLSTTGGSGTGGVSYAITAGGSFCSISGTTLSGIGVGSCTVTATKAGDTSFLPATASTTVSVSRASQATLMLVATPPSVQPGTSSTLSTTGGSGSGAVSYAITAGAGSCSLAGNIVTGVAVGSCTITATKAADANYLATTATRVVNVTAPDSADLQVLIAAPTTQALSGSPVVYTIIASNLGPAAALGAQLAVIPPAMLVDVIWQCVQAGSTATCPVGPGGAGSGTLSAQMNLPSGAHLRYDFSAVIQAPAGTQVPVTATLAAPASLVDPNLNNNSSTHTILVLAADTVFRSGFEGQSLVIEPDTALQSLLDGLGGGD